MQEDAPPSQDSIELFEGSAPSSQKLFSNVSGASQSIAKGGEQGWDDDGDSKSPEKKKNLFFDFSETQRASATQATPSLPAAQPDLYYFAAPNAHASHRNLKKLAESTILKLCSGPCISSLSSAVKELLENSLDARASNIQIRLSEMGLTGIEVKDNGVGIPRDDCEPGLLCQRYCTSKLFSLEDLLRISQYGFRGEALNSICLVSGALEITTKTADDPLAIKIAFQGSRAEQSTREFLHHPSQGTTVLIKNLFAPVPVRRQALKQNIKKEFKALCDTVCEFALIHPQVRFSLFDENSQEILKTSTKDLAVRLRVVVVKMMKKKKMMMMMIFINIIAS